MKLNKSLLLTGLLTASLTPAAFAAKAEVARGSVLIAAPTALNGPTNQGIWFIDPTTKMFSLDLPELSANEVYESWIVDSKSGKKISGGLFREGGIDSDAAGRFAGPLSLNFPSLPGSDFVTLGHDLADGAHHIVVTVEPYPDSDPAPSGMVVLATAIPAGTPVGTVLSFDPPAQIQAARNVAKYNLQNGVGLKGFDPVAVFPEGGGRPAKGQNQFQLNYMGVTYMFASAKNLDAFLENPDRYEPTYGGWCAYAMASGTQVDIQPEQFTIHGNRVHYFVNSRAKRNFDADVISHEVRADGFWKKISGEDPRR